MSPDKRAYSKSRPGSYLHAPRWTEQIMDSEACFQVMMLMHEKPWLWRWLFAARENGRSWREIKRQFGARCEASETNLLPIPNNPD